MEREILFRGFHKEPNGKDIVIINGTPECGTWLYGNLLRTDDGWYIIQNYIPPHMLSKYKVDPSTVGQYTGLTDKNGVKIFEGDIVKTHSGLIGRVAFGSFDDDETETDTYGWYWRGRDKEGNSYFLGLDPEWGGHQVIGNIHDDNPEMMGGEDDG